MEDTPDNDDLLEQIAQAYACGPKYDLDGTEVSLSEPVSLPQALGAVTTLRGLAEQQKEDYRGLLRQLASLEGHEGPAGDKLYPNYAGALLDR